MCASVCLAWVAVCKNCTDCVTFFFLKWCWLLPSVVCLQHVNVTINLLTTSVNKQEEHFTHFNKSSQIKRHVFKTVVDFWGQIGYHGKFLLGLVIGCDTVAHLWYFHDNHSCVHIWAYTSSHHSQTNIGRYIPLVILQ